MDIGLARMALFGVLALTMAGCGIVRDTFGRGDNLSVGLPFQASLSTAEETNRDFSVEVDAPGAEISDFRESARYPATRHCVETFGDSRIEWVLNPASGDWAVSRTETGEPIVSGSCVGR